MRAAQINAAGVEKACGTDTVGADKCGGHGKGLRHGYGWRR